MRQLPTLEALVGSDAPPLVLSLSCTGCGHESDQHFAWACVNPDLKACRAQGWDGVSLSRIVRCGQCGAIDAYAFAARSYLSLTAGVMAASSGGPAGRVLIAESRLWDGTLMRRPSQALARLRELTQLHKSSAEAHRRLGNGCDRFGLTEEAEAAWRRAVELDEHELEALSSLAELLLRTRARAPEGFSFLQRAVSAIPSAHGLDPDTRRSFVRGLFGMLRAFPAAGEPLALMAAWSGSASTAKQPIVHMSSVDLRDVLDVWDELVDFAASTKVLSLELTNELPEDPEPQLLALLVGGVESPVPVPKTPVIAAPKIGRNEPCPCGSGKKFKRCCAGESSTGSSTG